jgi:hypothetical protein
VKTYPETKRGGAPAKKEKGSKGGKSKTAKSAVLPFGKDLSACALSLRHLAQQLTSAAL